MLDAIFVDVDETLVYTTHWQNAPCVEEGGFSFTELMDLKPEELQKKACGPADKVVLSQRHTYVSRLRPNAVQFLKTLRTMAKKVYVLSKGQDYFVERVMKIHGLDGLIDGWFGREVYAKVPKLPNVVLIDDRDRYDWVVGDKAVAMGIIDTIERDLIVIPCFLGDLKDNAFESVIKKLEERVL
jgi:hypothetical protein